MCFPRPIAHFIVLGLGLNIAVAQVYSFAMGVKREIQMCKQRGMVAKMLQEIMEEQMGTLELAIAT